MAVFEIHHAHDLVVAPGQQGGAGRRANRFGVKTVVPDDFFGQLVDVGRGDFRTIRLKVRKPHVIQDDVNNVRPVIVWLVIFSCPNAPKGIMASR